MKVYVIQSKNPIKMNAWCECKELDDWDSCKNNQMWSGSTCDCEYNKACKIDEFVENI